MATIDNTVSLQLGYSQEFLAFTLGSEEYGIDIQKVQELRKYEGVTHIADAPAFFKGVSNLRGNIVPILDLRIKLNVGEPSYDHSTVVIIVNVQGQTVGVVVDGVTDVVAFTPAEIKTAPKTYGVDTDYLLGIGIKDQRMVILAEVDKLASADALISVHKLAA